ncbi:cob(I)yrinic acid a,c-diamide adenosyltransferase [Anaerosalibacter massiliensis]|uniref:Corrinoid adenosyltransferase n=1 Tax=Anaerosalibacter massiliensis TaxID=1347392 RepID=A0A9X2S6Q2_9FIRM|nr:cob(I)yrinic acid a,c-diamide adenosyltransferase [Anaerosalibacter massiliensis]MCR2043877.1 cob(I)yrinic acid a,c-diamide adenosyltransferase [Anaerosalibacter massiliensis]
MNIYTKTGDKGKTSLFDNKRVSKDSIRVESYGTVDELVAFLGLAKNYVDDEKIYDLITEIQNKLFTVAATLATEDTTKLPYSIKEEDIKFLEQNIDECMAKVNKPTGFVIPGSGKASAYLHVSRTICRRAERRIITLSNSVDINPHVIKYVNRLADLIYAIARVVEAKEEKVNFKN